MRRRGYIKWLASSPLLSYLPSLDIFEADEIEIYDVVAISAHYTDYSEEISYRCEEEEFNISYEDRSYEDWLETISRDARNQEWSVPVITTLSDADLRALTLKPDYSHSVFDIGEYQIQIHGGTENVDSELYVEYYSDINEFKTFKANGHSEIQEKLDGLEVIL